MTRIEKINKKLKIVLNTVTKDVDADVPGWARGMIPDTALHQLAVDVVNALETDFPSADDPPPPSTVGLPQTMTLVNDEGLDQYDNFTNTGYVPLKLENT